MSNTRIIEMSEHPSGHWIATIQTRRGDEFIVDMNQAAMNVADALSDEIHESKGGWSLQPGYFVEAFKRVKQACFVTSMPAKDEADVRA